MHKYINIATHTDYMKVTGMYAGALGATSETNGLLLVYNINHV